MKPQAKLADDNTPKRRRGPYFQWSLTNSKMPKSTKFSRVSAGPSQTLFKRNISKKRHKLTETVRSQICKVSQPPLPKPPCPSTATSHLTSQVPSVLSAHEEVSLDQVFSIPEHLTSTSSHRCLAGAHQKEISDIDIIEPVHEELVDPCVELHELETFQMVDEVENDELLNTSVYSEESFILRLETSDQEEEDPEPDDIEVIDEDSSDEESSDMVLTEASDLFLSISQRIHILLLLATMKRHNLTYSAAEDIMSLAGVLTQCEVFLPPRHLIKRTIEAYSCGITEHHICPACNKYNGVKSSETFKCEYCNETVSTQDNKKQGNMFLYLSMKEQLEELLKYHYDDILKPQERKKIDPCNYEDIYDGNYYKKNISANTLTVNFFVDGLQIATTSKKSAWPVLACLNELPLPLRRKHIFLVALWLSLKKPNCNEYLKPFVKECAHLEENGLSFVKNGHLIHFKVKVIVGISDTIARPLLRHSIQFNGLYGCGLCLHPGFRMKYGRGHIRSYSTNAGKFPNRSHDELMQMAREAEQAGKPVKGIKGISVLSKLKDFNMVRGLDLDFFHALVNVCKRFANLWFLEKYNSKPFGLSSRFAEVNARLLQITPTSDVSRNPRSLKDRSDFRGHEWFHWVIEYSIPVLKGILPAKFLNHWSLLVHGVALIMQNSVAKSELAYAGRYFSLFVSGIDDLYGKHHVTFSSHLLTHLEDSVSEYGQPWAHSAFIFESYLAEVKQAVKSSNGASLQICKAMQRKIALRKLEEDVVNSMTDSQQQYFQAMSTGRKLAPAHLTIGAASLLGKPRSGPLSLESMAALRRAGVQCGENSSLLLYDRCQLHNEVYHSVNYTKATKQNNSVVLLVSQEVFIIQSFVVLNNECYVLGNVIEDNRQKKLCDMPLPHIKVLKEEPEVRRRCLPVCYIDSKLLSFTIKSQSGDSLRIACVNVLKMEMLR
ncbi:Tagatose-6-phosphate kinase [Frankliniella fusca]|uniref:Tagatose-6-phosphate kinase n=1 Tax=Frankliniella fusca TaxID=407009 RepID=A0AAE1HV82_9NEOP|nr:Tagatose-6-phosphate kinase [Frankliniella fusca]